MMNTTFWEYDGAAYTASKCQIKEACISHENAPNLSNTINITTYRKYLHDTFNSPHRG